MEKELDTKQTKEKCTCPKTCDCQNPPPNNWDGKKGVYHSSFLCPIHNLDPVPAEDCPVHNPEHDILSS